MRDELHRKPLVTKSFKVKELQCFIRRKGGSTPITHGGLCHGCSDHWICGYGAACLTYLECEEMLRCCSGEGCAQRLFPPITWDVFWHFSAAWSLLRSRDPQKFLWGELQHSPSVPPKWAALTCCTPGEFIAAEVIDYSRSFKLLKSWVF